MIHEGCGGMIWLLFTGEYWCMNCGEIVPEDKITEEIIRDDDE